MNAASFLLAMSISISVGNGQSPDVKALAAMAKLDLAPPKGEAILDGKVVKVLDGDTIRVKTDTGLATVRLANIDAPEKRQPGGLLAAAALASAIGGKQVLVHVVAVDRYGRFVGSVVDKKKRDISVNVMMACSGFAWAAEKRYLVKDTAAICEALARKAKMGLWGWRVKHEAPWRFRHKK